MKDLALMRAVRRRVVGLLDEFTGQGLANTVWAFATLEVAEEEVPSPPLCLPVGGYVPGLIRPSPFGRRGPLHPDRGLWSH